nr:hypothetical protein [Candidatus Njordarchaeum guaymaensis]
MSSKQYIRNEDDFLLECYNVRKSYTGDKGRVYPKVSSIPKGRKIAPDIDLLEIKNIGQTESIIGYEVKLLRKTDPYGPFYAGLGETLSYFKNGIDKAYLIMGFFDVESKRFKEVRATINLTVDFLIKSGLHLLNYVQHLILGDHDRLSTYLSGSMDPTRGFSVSSYVEPRHKRDCVLRNEFEWGKVWLKRRQREIGSNLESRMTS